MNTSRLTGAPLSRTTPGDWIAINAHAVPNHACLVDGITEQVWTFAEINARVNRLARALRSRGVERGDRIGILATDSVDYMTLLLASLKIGTTYVPFNYRLAPDEIAACAEAARIDALFVGPAYAEQVGALRGRAPIRLAGALGAPGATDGLESVTEMIESEPDDSDVEVVTDWEDIVSVMFTSGTTSRPKGVLQSMRMVRAVTMSGIIDFRLRRDDFRYSASPMFHVAGMGCVYYGIARGFASLILPQYDAHRVVHWMSEGGLTGVLLMPTMLSELLAEPSVRERTYPTLRSIAYGGAPITPALLRDALDVFQCDFYNSFGAGTEAGGQTMFYPEDHLRALDGREHLLGSIGRAMFGVDLRLCDENMNDVAPGEVGEICTRSESVMSGYLDDPERTAAAVVDGWFRAGDMAWMDDEGYLYLATRKTDMIIRGGENVYPVEIESVLAEHPDVAEVAVVGLPDDHWGQIVAAAVVPRAGRVPTQPELAEFCHGKLAKYKVPVVVVGRDALPKNANGKVHKHLLAEQLAAQHRAG